ncbi:aliphatic sulphonate ABC transporter periplasmic protein [Komagataeibacter diospyri]|uniref:aliphatic sulfonate ABC transporter substrate-binding protein n=1 Tax=Komagataeibacter diospyri TaxID=1932662 RepID=UPI00113BAAEF|nr:aliphatic sulfonate ABC transporter substrate-binding protein [Komagataeibacter diospyri]GCE90832.1 aliphatic sulphonate ABC transporter periplasmic protein [Komagataeibacter diospyri]
MKRYSRRTFLTGLGVTLSSQIWATRGAYAAQDATIRIGYQQYGTLVVLKHSGLLERALAPGGMRVQWSEFIAGPQLLQALAADAIDIGETGNAPPVMAQAAWPDGLSYIGCSAPAPHGEGMLVPANSPIQTPADLKGRRIALNRGSNVHYLLLALLQRTGVAWTDIHPVYLPPAASRAAFETGRVDAWAIWDPYLSAALVDTQSRLLVDAQGITTNRQFLIASRRFADRNPGNFLTLLAQARQDCVQWAADHVDTLTTSIAASTGLSRPVITRALAQLALQPAPLDQAVVTEQQDIAATLFHAHLIQTVPDVRAIVRGA